MATIENTEVNLELVSGTPAGKSKSWNWHPDIPIRTNPLFELPLKPLAIIKWFGSAWLPVTEFGLYLLFAILVWHWLVPPMAVMQTLEAGWVAAVWLRNLLLMTLFATSLHLWLYTGNCQGDDTRFMRSAPNARHWLAG